MIEWSSEGWWSWLVSVTAWWQCCGLRWGVPLLAHPPNHIFGSIVWLMVGHHVRIPSAKPHYNELLRYIRVFASSRSAGTKILNLHPNSHPKCTLYHIKGTWDGKGIEPREWGPPHPLSARNEWSLGQSASLYSPPSSAPHSEAPSLECRGPWEESYPALIDDINGQDDISGHIDGFIATDSESAVVFLIWWSVWCNHIKSIPDCEMQWCSFCHDARLWIEELNGLPLMHTKTVQRRKGEAVTALW